MKSKMCIALAATLLSLNAAAETPTFNYVKVGFTEQDPEYIGVEQSGFEVAGAYDLDKEYYIAGKYISTSDDNLDSVRGTIGVGYKMDLTDDTLMFFQIDYAAIEFDQTNAGTFDESGFQVGLGFRSYVSDSFEVNGVINYLDAGKVDDTFGDFNQTFIQLGGEYYMNDEFSIYADYEYDSDASRYAVGVKYSF
ncbi:outer membrane beta-barrel protein [Aliikangiella marina]|uniref:Outer membrane beta-barrel protein n=1 Tax=Aliikangiella marina TaxID=1712262 RepID=A0A545TA14_9GAMM|nr:outer membrane beta-barrel protein [Aliikangiella marina]TQV74047.1 outer membrane beta-barrel protein [Aliikangiella marina]